MWETIRCAHINNEINTECLIIKEHQNCNDLLKKSR